MVRCRTPFGEAVIGEVIRADHSRHFAPFIVDIDSDCIQEEWRHTFPDPDGVEVLA